MLLLHIISVLLFIQLNLSADDSYSQPVSVPWKNSVLYYSPKTFNTVSVKTRSYFPFVWSSILHLKTQDIFWKRLFICLAWLDFAWLSKTRPSSSRSWIDLYIWLETPDAFPMGFMLSAKISQQVRTTLPVRSTDSERPQTQDKFIQSFS